MNRLAGFLAVAPLLAACSGNPGSASAPDIYHIHDTYWYMPPGYYATCENRQLAVTTPDGDTVKGPAAVDTLQAAGANRVEQADAVTGKPVIGMSRTTCQNAYGRWSYPPTVQGPAESRAAGDATQPALSECNRLARRGRSAVGSVAGSVGVPSANCPPAL